MNDPRKKTDMNNPFKPAHVKPPRPSNRTDRTASLGVALAEGRANPAHEPWLANMAQAYNKRGRGD